MHKKVTPRLKVGREGHGGATRRDHLPFEDGHKRNDPKSIKWVKVRVIEDSNSEGKDETSTVEIQSHDKSRGGAPIPHYPPQAPLPTLPLLSSTLLLAQHAQKRHTKVEGREGRYVN